MGLLRLVGSSLTLLALVTAVVSIACLLSVQHVLNLSSLTCFGLGAPSKVFVEMQIAKDVAYVFDSSQLVHEQQTVHQMIEVYAHPFFGNILVIDGSLQITQRDEVNYHEMMVHLPLAYMPEARKALIIGGGDGGALSRVLQHRNIEVAYLIDIDMHAMRQVAQNFFPQLHASFLDRRTKALSYDGNQWVQEQLLDPEQMGSIELIIVDSTDYGSAEPLFSDDFYVALGKLLHSSRGVLVINLDSPSWNLEVVSSVQRQLARVFRFAFVFHSQQPSFLSGHYSYLFVSNNVHPMKAKIDWDAWDRKRLHTYYYSPDLHYASFVLPNSQRRALSMAGQLRDVPADHFYGRQLEQDVWHEVRIAPERLPAMQGSSREGGGGEL